ncbi:SDR family oxidoreductase [Plantactinospora soyae]|uniref:NAD(P)-dependent dehydrogenase (Short-subunit alcohol dehydrogenase family) n=1 Tax=Plantactinospora soyae TaxID=1544732 RepID=A0A927R077_9ACTN|nr:SDR family oxidoreductase [Plantactinospora soyae]MBE1489887.1 NAD(P)-dependent dehydrogenase (short-subunit alcohol dehydrogenase family) [Plantactinospora soyae]
MQIEDAVVLVTGGNRGLGRAIAAEAVARGARKVYAAARDPRTVTDPGVVPLALDVTDPESVAAAARVASDVTILVNNAASSVNANFLDSDVEGIRREFETNFYGPLLLTQAFVPGIVANGGGHILNINSVLSWIGLTDSYSASKAALWSMTNSVRLQLLPKGVGVTGLHVGYIDTDMSAHVDAPKIAPEDVARQAIDGIEAGAFEVLADGIARQVRASLSAEVAAMYPQLAAA